MKGASRFLQEPVLKGSTPQKPRPLWKKPPAPAVAATPTEPVSETPTGDLAALAEVMLQVVSEKTGYPTEMLSLDMDMEADLGIDSINRVEILAGVQEQYPHLPQINPEELTELRTLQEIVAYIGRENGNSTSPAVAEVPAPAVMETPAPAVAATPTEPVSETPTGDLAALAEVMLQVVSEKTGYPTEMLSLDMDMEADLGIDSINRVEILAGVQEQYPHLPQINPEELTELRTLQEIVAYIGRENGNSTSPAMVEVPAPAVMEKTPAPAVAATPTEPVSETPTGDLAALAEVMLQVVSEKTGYPTEMLSLDMDMEADLGIDSINRVEILAGVQEQYPHLPQINPEELTELRTLQEIVAYIGRENGNSTSPAVAEAPAPAVMETPAPAVAATPTEPVSETPTGDLAALAEVMLQVVSEKTGYPTEMLSLDMDMEADLGIDSINRVEILAGVQEQYPHLPQINPEELTELRTLQEIVAYIGRENGNSTSPAVVEVPAPAVMETPAPAVAATPTEPVSETPTGDLAALAEVMLQVVSEKTGYPTEMLSLDMDMEADLGIDSINRVEILAGVQEQYPHLPQINPEELTELRTLQEIVAYIGRENGNSTSPAVVEVPAPVVMETPAPAVAATPTEPVSETPTGDLAALAEVMLQVVSEKTGYPTEMLSLDMDMEADLGIDSINRVEILAGVQEQYPHLPQINPEELTELRTLQEIVSHISQPAVTQNGKNGRQPQDGPVDESHSNGQPAPPALKDEPLPAHNIKRGVAGLKWLPDPDFMELELPSGHICLVTDDGSEGSLKLAQTLQAKGWPVVVFSFPGYIVTPQIQWPADMPRVALSDLSESHLQQQLSQIAQQHGPVGVFIHLNPQRPANPTQLLQFNEAEKALAKHLFLIAKHLQQSLAQATSATFLTVARLDGALGLADATNGQAHHPAAVNFSPVDGGLFGLTKTLNLEWPAVYCRAV